LLFIDILKLIINNFTNENFKILTNNYVLKNQDWNFNFNNTKNENVCSNHIWYWTKTIKHTLLTLYMFNLPNTKFRAPSYYIYVCMYIVKLSAILTTRPLGYLHNTSTPCHFLLGQMLVSPTKPIGYLSSISIPLVTFD